MVQRSKAPSPENRQGSGKGGKRSTSFKPGKSGNPGGRPKKTDEERTLEAMCREHTLLALATVLAIMDAGEIERNRLAAAQFIIERGWGKAVQAVEHSGSIGLHETALEELA